MRYESHSMPHQSLHFFLNLAVKSLKWESLNQTSPTAHHARTTPVPEATVHVPLPNMARVGFMHGSEAKRETDTALPISYEIIAVFQGVVLLCLTMLPEPIMAPMNWKCARVLRSLFFFFFCMKTVTKNCTAESCLKKWRIQL